MSHQVYKFEPGQCTCILGDPGAGSHRVNVRRLSGLEAVLDPAFALKENQFVYTTVKLEDGPSLALSGLVVTSAAGGILIQWMHSNPRDADKVDAAVSEYIRAKEKRSAAAVGTATPPSAVPSAPAPSASARPAVVLPSVAQPSAPVASQPSAPAAPVVQTPALASTPAAPVLEASTKPPPSAAVAYEQKTERITRPAKIRAMPKAGAPKKAQSAAESKSRAAEQKSAESPSSADGSLDVGARLRSKSKTVLSSELASRLETVQVVNMGAIRNLVKEAVDESMALHGAALQDADKKRLLEEAEASFAERLQLYKSEKSGLEEQIKTLDVSFKRAQQLLEEERSKVLSANQFTVSDAGMVELEQRLGRLLDHAIQTGKMTPQFEEEMRGVVVRLLDDERAKIREQAQQAQSDKIALLEKKVQRLASSLESAESERDFARERAQLLEAAGGPLRNVMLAGLDGKDPRREKKLGLLKEIYKINKEIREQLVSAGRMPKAASASPQASSGEPSGAETPHHAAEEARIASELGIKRSAPSATTPSPSVASAAQASIEMVEKQAAPAAAEVPVLAVGSEADPDDLPWEPPSEEASKEPKSATIKKLKRGR